MRRIELVGYLLVIAGVVLPYVMEHLFGTAALSACTFVLIAGGGAVLLFINRRTREEENGGAVATLFGGGPVLDIASAGQHTFEVQFPEASKPEAEPENTSQSAAKDPGPEFAELAVEYSYNDRDSARARNQPLLVKNVTPGKDAYNVRFRPMEAPHDKLRFNPEKLARITGGDQIEVIPEPGLIEGGYVRASRNHLPDFLSGYFNSNGTHDIQALTEIYEEKSLTMEIEYESEGKRLLARCELRYTPWHRNISTGKQEVRVLNKPN